MTRVRHVATSFSDGGASAAATRIVRGTEHFVDVGTCVGALGRSARISNLPWWLAARLQMSGNPVHRSLNILPSETGERTDLASVDTVHLHWVGDELISIRQIGSLAQTLPVVWTLHDTWAFTGADHHPKDESDIRYRLGYTRESRLPGDGRIDVDAWVFRRKLRHWKSPMWLVAPSSYVKQMAQESYLASSWPVTVIPNPLDVEVFKPLDREDRQVVRNEFRLPSDKPLVLFGSGSRAAYTKGMDLLPQALQLLHERMPDAAFATFGPEDLTLPSWVTQLGYIEEEKELRNLYATADAVIVSSRFETFSQVASEAQACGTPVAAFATSGLLDVVDDGITGILAEPYDPAALAEAVTRVLEAGEPMRTAARERAERLWSMDVVGKQYADWYQTAIIEFHSKKSR